MILTETSSIVFAFVRLGVLISEANSLDVTCEKYHQSILRLFPLILRTGYEAKLIWANVELMVGVFAACAPCYAPLLRVRDSFRGLVVSLRYFMTSSPQRQSQRLPESNENLELRDQPVRQQGPKIKQGVTSTADGGDPDWSSQPVVPLEGRIMVRKDLSQEEEERSASPPRFKKPEGWDAV